MKKILVVSLLVVILFYLYSNNDNKRIVDTNDEVRGIFISYIEYMNHFDNKNEDEIKLEIDKMIDNIANDKFNLMLLHVRPFSDSIYPSNIYPLSYTITGEENRKLDIDILKYFIDKAHSKNIKIHAWINPYRIRNTTDVGSISVASPAFKWIGTNNVSVIKDKGIYYNPASSEVNDLIVSGIEEIINNYEIDGIVLDDYFYPDKNIDLDNYNEYVSLGGNKDIDEYRFDNVTSLVSRICDTIKRKNKDILFGISPDANIDNNYNSNYADIITWINNRYIDYVMPQIYYGFENEDKPFIKTLNEWNNYIKSDVALIPALAFYKIGIEDMYAKSGKSEWVNSSNIIRNQVLVSRNMPKYEGFSLFRYDNFYSDNEQVMNEKKELINIL